MLKFWPFPLLRNHSSSSELTELFLKFAAAPDLRVIKRDEFRMTVSCSLGELSFWCANAYYAWAESGSFLRGGRTDEWIDEMPSRYAVRAMRKAIAAKRFALDAEQKVEA